MVVDRSYLKRLRQEQALILLLWVHVFRYCMLYTPVARHEGYGICDVAATQLGIGDLTGSIPAAIAIVALRLRPRLGMFASWLVVVGNDSRPASKLGQTGMA